MVNKFKKAICDKINAVLGPLVAWDGSYEDDCLSAEINAIATRYKEGARMVKRDIATLARGVERCMELDKRFAIA